MSQPKGKPSNNRKKIKPTKHPLAWFVERIGKKVFRKDTGTYGVEIKSEIHAKALEMYQNDLDLYYQDKPFIK